MLGFGATLPLFGWFTPQGVGNRGPSCPIRLPICLLQNAKLPTWLHACAPKAWSRSSPFASAMGTRDWRTPLWISSAISTEMLWSASRSRPQRA
jgi:hypothetical protein